jgi:glucose-6-phosphate dehydrogenase assembly protein OpcA
MSSVSASSTDFLSGQGVPVELHDVESELARLWGPAAEQVGGPEVEHPNVTRIVLANLVVYARDAGAARLEGVLDTVTARYPSRTIVLQRTADPGRSIQADVSALCHLPAPGLPQVCSERILLRAGPNAGDLLPGAVRPLLEADLPFVLWWTDNPSADEPLFRDLGDECTRLILDLPDPGTPTSSLRLGLDPTICPHSRDAAWFGLSRWRELLAQFFDPPVHNQNLVRIDSVRIEAIAPSNQTPPRLAVWLAAWLAGQLGWKPVGVPDRTPGRLAARFQGPSGAVALEVVTEVGTSGTVAELSATTITTRAQASAEPERFRLSRASRHSSEVHVEINSCSYCTLPRTVLAPELDPARRVSAALESSRIDPPFQNALPHALWLLGG